MYKTFFRAAVAFLILVALPGSGFAATGELAKLEASAAKGNAEDMAYLGTLHILGSSGAPKDYAKAFYWWEKAAKAGNMNGMAGLCQAYGVGYGVKVDYKKALPWCTKAANAGHTGAMKDLSLMYERGYGVPKSGAKAAAWMEKAARKGDMTAQRITGANYETGNGVKKDFKKAEEWYQLAAQSGSPSAKENLKALANKRTVQHRVGPIILDAPASFSSTTTKENHLFLMNHQDGYVHENSGKGYPELLIDAERTGKRGMTLESYLEEKYAPFKTFTSKTPPAKVGEGTYLFHVQNYTVAVMQLAGTDILVWIQICYETDATNQIISTIRPAE